MMRRVVLTSLVPLALSSAALAQVSDEDRFTTGPPPSSDRDGRPGFDRSSGLLGPQTDPEGDDIQVNQTRRNAQNETSVAINPNDPDNWVGVANDYRNGTVETGWYSTLDGGETWTTGTFGIRSGFSFSGDPCVTFTPNGDAHVVFMNYSGPGGSAVSSVRSMDGGQTWGAILEVDLDGANDKPQVDADMSDGPRRGDITTAWDRFGSRSDIYVSTSSDNGGSWSNSQRINDNTSRNTISPDVAYGANSELYVMWADRGSFEVWVDKSTDGGQTWGTDFFVTDYTQVPSPIPGSSFRMFDIFSMAADWTDGPYSGYVYVAWHTWNRGAQHANVRCSVSADGGQSWTTQTVHDTGLGQVDQIFPGCDTDPHGNVHVTFYDRRLDPSNRDLWTWIARSSDGGLTWEDRQVSDAGWNSNGTEFSTFIGDYIDVDAGSRNVIPFWCDGRSGGTQDVYADILSLDLFTDVDTLSAATGGQAQFTINPGPNHAGATYFLLGTFSGTDPGITFSSGVFLPLNWDLFTTITLTQANTAAFANFRGTLDPTGSATATLDTLGPFDPAAAGIDLDFAVLLLDGDFTFGSNPTRVSLTN